MEKNKRPRNEDLPDWVDMQWFRRTFVTTYMAFVGQLADPWDVPVKQSVLVMQKIWDAKTLYEYEITASTAIYKKVCDNLTSRTTKNNLLQMIQRLSDSWCNAIGSTGIAVVLAFCDSEEELANSDEERVEFAKYYLEGLRFLYRDTDGDDKKVCYAVHPLVV